jgi:hypothetical protein
LAIIWGTVVPKLVEVRLMKEYVLRRDLNAAVASERRKGKGNGKWRRKDLEMDVNVPGAEAEKKKRDGNESVYTTQQSLNPNHSAIGRPQIYSDYEDDEDWDTDVID